MKLFICIIVTQVSTHMIRQCHDKEMGILIHFCSTCYYCWPGKQKYTFTIHAKMDKIHVLFLLPKQSYVKLDEAYHLKSIQITDLIILPSNSKWFQLQYFHGSCANLLKSIRYKPNTVLAVYYKHTDSNTTYSATLYRMDTDFFLILSFLSSMIYMPI